MDRPREEALAAYIRENQARLYRLAFSFMRNSDDAMDVVQDAVVKAFEKEGTLRDRETMKTWFYRILVNTCIDSLRRRKRLVYTDADLERADASQEERVLESVTLYQALDRLPQEMKLVVTLRFFEDMKLSEIAQVTGAGVNTVKTRLYRALAQLRLTMGEEEEA